MSSTEKKTIELKDALRDAAMASSPSFPDFAQVYKKAEQQPKKLRRYVFSAATLAVAAAASFWIGTAWNSRASGDVALIDSWSASQTPAVSITTKGGQQSQVVLASSQSDAVSFFVQDLWANSSGGGL